MTPLFTTGTLSLPMTLSAAVPQSAEPALFSLAWLRIHGIRIALVVALAVAVSCLANLAVRRFRRRLEGSQGATIAVSLQRSTTLASTLTSAIRTLVWSVAILTVLGELGFDLGPLLAGAGVAGIALGFGAQSLVKDFLAGFFVLLENQFGVGEMVELNVVGGTVTGRVETMTLRSTSIRHRDGTLSTVLNGNLQLVSNKSRGRGELTVDVTVSGGPDLTEADADRQLDQVVEELRRDEGLLARVSSAPVSAGVEPAEDGGGLTVKVAAETRPSRKDEVEQEIRRRIVRKFLGDERGGS